MKRIYLVFAGLTLLMLAVIVVLFLQKPIVLKPLFGAGRVLFPPANCEVRINAERSDHLCYRTTAFSNESVEMLVVYRFNSIDERNEALIVNISEKVAGLPNTSKDDFYLFGDYFLFQSDSGGAYVPFESSKFDPNDPKYLFEPNYIKFISPYPSPLHTVEIVLKD